MRDEIKRAFGAVQADAALREGTKGFLAQRLYRRPARRLRPAPLLACLALLAVALAGGRFYYTPRLTVSIDVKRRGKNCWLSGRRNCRPGKHLLLLGQLPGSSPRP